MYIILGVVALCSGVVSVAAFMSGSIELCLLSAASGLVEIVLIQMFVILPIRRMLGGSRVNKGLMEVRWLGRELDGMAERIAMLKLKSTRDELTGLYNRTYLSMQSRMYDRHDSLYIVSLDVNNLKRMNDEFGHSAGDALLKNAADSLSYWQAYGDVYRMGGDEFMVVLVGHKESECTELFDNWERRDMRLNRCEDGFECRFAYGVAYGKDFDTLCEMADVAMYKKKAEIKGTI